MSYILFPAIFALSSIVLLMTGAGAPYLRKLEDLSFFMGGQWFFNHCMSVPAGFIDWIASFLTQFFYYPWLGATIFTAALIGLWALTSATFRLPRNLSPAAIVPSAMMLLFALMPGYLIYMSKTPGFIWSGVIGFSFSIAATAVFRASRRPLVRAIIIIICTFTYPLFGFYSLLGAGLCAVDEICNRQRRIWWIAITGVALAVVIPQLYFYLFESHAMLSHIYTAGIPRMAADFQPLMLTYWITIGTLIFMSALFHSGRKTTQPKSAGYISAAIFAISVISIFVCRFRDANFETMVAMDIAISDGDNSAAIRKARELKEEPTRAVEMLTHAALFHRGDAPDSMFTFPQGAAEYASPYPFLALRLSSAHSLNYLFGRLNDCYRWCMEDMVEYGYKTEYLRYMSKCALMNGEYNLARRYLRMISGSMFHSGEAEKYLRYADNPELIGNDPEMASIKPLTAYDSQLGGDSGLIEHYISSNVAALAGGPPALVELSLQFNMKQKDIAEFWPRFMLYARTHDRLPVHYQEAALLFSALENEVDWHRFAIDPEIAERFERFMTMARQNSNYSEEYNRKAFHKDFSDTYWFYYFFINDLKTT